VTERLFFDADNNYKEIVMKKFVSIAAVMAALAITPTAASAHAWKNNHNHHAEKGIVLIGAGAGAGALIAGPVGAVVGGVAALFIVAVDGDGY
jgi:hypothetical protein